MPNDFLPKKIIANTLGTFNFSINEIRDGISKRVYKIDTQNKSFILYLWLKPFEGNLTENKIKGIEYLWPDGFNYFLNNTKLLTDIGIRVPQIIKAGHYDEGNFDYAIVEHFSGQSLKDFMQNNGDIADIANNFIDVMNRLSCVKRDFYGSPCINTPNDISAIELVYRFEEEELNIASNIDDEIKSYKENILILLENLKNKIVENNNQSYSLIHGEMTPPHLFILKNKEIGVIDIEAIKFFDIEYDWAVIELMYGGKVKLPQGINQEKLDFYKLCLKVGYMAIGADYIRNIDKNNMFFMSIRDSNLKDIKIMLEII